MKTQQLAQRGSPSGAAAQSSVLFCLFVEVAWSMLRFGSCMRTFLIEFACHGLWCNVSMGTMIDSILGIYWRSAWVRIKIGCTTSLDCGV